MWNSQCMNDISLMKNCLCPKLSNYGKSIVIYVDLFVSSRYWCNGWVIIYYRILWDAIAFKKGTYAVKWIYSVTYIIYIWISMFILQQFSVNLMSSTIPSCADLFVYWPHIGVLREGSYVIIMDNILAWQTNGALSQYKDCLTQVWGFPCYR